MPKKRELEWNNIHGHEQCKINEIIDLLHSLNCRNKKK